MAEKKSKKKAPKKTKVYECYHYEYEYDDLGKYCWCHNGKMPRNECNVVRKGFYCQQFCPGYKKGKLRGSWVISNWEKKEAEEYKTKKEEIVQAAAVATRIKKAKKNAGKIQKILR